MFNATDDDNSLPPLPKETVEVTLSEEETRSSESMTPIELFARLPESIQKSLIEGLGTDNTTAAGSSALHKTKDTSAEELAEIMKGAEAEADDKPGSQPADGHYIDERGRWRSFKTGRFVKKPVVYEIQ